MTQTLPSPAVTDPELLAFAREVGSTGNIAVAGGWTRWSTGGELAEGTSLVSAPKGMVDYRPDEMTVRVRAGTTVKDLHEILQAEGQMSALPERGGTVGGAIAVGENCLRVLGRGRLRTSLLQLRYVSAEGQLVTGGGATVKNVSGFDIPRLMVGSIGTLGLIGEVLLRTNPAPERTLLLSSSDADPMTVRDAILRPNMILWDGTTTWVELAGNPEAVESERQKLSERGTFTQSAVLPTMPPHRWSLRPSDLKDCGTVQNTGPFIASIGVGTVFASNPQPARKLDTGAAIVQERMKTLFDPTGRLNPGRTPGGV